MNHIQDVVATRAQFKRLPPIFVRPSGYPSFPTQSLIRPNQILFRWPVVIDGKRENLICRKTERFTKKDDFPKHAGSRVWCTEYLDPRSPSKRRVKKERIPCKSTGVAVTPPPTCVQSAAPIGERDVYEAPWPAEFYSSYPYDRAAVINSGRPFDYSGANYISAYPYDYAPQLPRQNRPPNNSLCPSFFC